MIMQIFSVYDSKAEAFMQPFFMTSKGQAVRAFTDLVRDDSSSLNKHPEDYALFHIGQFDDSDASISMLAAPQSLGLAIEYVCRE